MPLLKEMLLALDLARVAGTPADRRAADRLQRRLLHDDLKESGLLPVRQGAMGGWVGDPLCCVGLGGRLAVWCRRSAGSSLPQKRRWLALQYRGSQCLADPTTVLAFALPCLPLPSTCQVLARLIKGYNFRFQPRSHGVDLVETLHVVLGMLDRLSAAGKLNKLKA